MQKSFNTLYKQKESSLKAQFMQTIPQQAAYIFDNK